MRISDWSSDVCSSDLARAQIWRPARSAGAASLSDADQFLRVEPSEARSDGRRRAGKAARRRLVDSQQEDGRGIAGQEPPLLAGAKDRRSEEHTSELQSLMRTSYAVFCLKKKNK